MFLGYGGDKEFDVKSYVDASLTPIRIALSRANQICIVEQPFGIAPSEAWKQHL